MLEELYKRVSRTLSIVLTVATRISNLQTKSIEAEHLRATQAVPRQDHNPRNIISQLNIRNEGWMFVIRRHEQILLYNLGDLFSNRVRTRALRLD